MNGIHMNSGKYSSKKLLMLKANRKLSASANSQSVTVFEKVESFFEKVEKFFEKMESFF